MPTLTMSLIAALVATTSVMFVKLYRARMRVRDRQRRGMPIAPEHSLLFGHSLYFMKMLKRLPSDAHYSYIFSLIAREHFQDEGCFYLDLWPFVGLLLVAVSPQMSVQVTQTNPALHSKRPDFLRKFFKPITGGPSLFDLPEKDWKPWRAVFNRGFQTQRIMSLIPGMVEQTMTYIETLRGLAEKGEMCFLEPPTLRFSIDMIGKNLVGTLLNAQKGWNPLADGMLSTLAWNKTAADINPFSRLNFVRMFVHWRNGRQMDRYIGAEIDKRYESYKANPEKTGVSVMDLVMQGYLSAPEKGKTSNLTEKLDAEFRAFAIRQIRLFIFVGYDANATVLCYCFHYLSKNPEALARLRAEHDDVLGKDAAAAGSRLTEDACLVNRLPYTLAVIKEVMRLFPPACGDRQGQAGVSITNDKGDLCETDDTIIQFSHITLHRNPKYWVRPDDFLPERWLVPVGHELYPQQNSWRPFESGPRNCIAQALVLTELRIMLACLVRTFDITPAYDEYDEKHPRKGIQTYEGERAYLIERGAAHPTAGYPCRVAMAAGGKL